ncbi:DUF4112 domain-containing protein [Rhodobacteraceae bacterium MCCB 386]|nr:DUF4112 domain-containing protein [Roseitranquillus sediminis]
MERVENIARLMDSAIRIPVIGYRIGLDGILGLIPGVGDAAALAPAGYIIYLAHRMGAPRHALVQMGANVAADALIGSIPLVGDLFDFAFKANKRNLKILRKHVDLRRAEAAAEAGRL